MIGFGRKKGAGKPSGQGEDRKTQAVESPPTGDSLFKKLPPLFNSLSEKQINQLYATAVIKKTGRGEMLFQKGEKANSLFILIEGQLEKQDGTKALDSDATPGSMPGSREFFDESLYAETTKAASPSVVMVIGKTALTMLDTELKAFIFEQMIQNDSREIHRLEVQNRRYEAKISSLGKCLYSARTARIFDYNESDLILSIIKKIPKLPAYTHSLSSRLLDETVSSKEIIDLIRQDPALVADVLKSVNSSYYGLGQKVSDINSAVLLLGFQSLYQLVVSEGIRRTMPDTPDFRQIHAHALALSYITFSVSITAKVGVPVQMATIGLLHNIGESVISLLKQRNPNLMVFIDALDRPSLGAFLLEGWNFPESMSRTVRYQNFPEFTEPSDVPEDILRPVAILYISQLCYAQLRGVREKDLPLLYFDDYRKILKVKEVSLEDFTRKNIVPDLKKKQETLPLSIKELILSW